MIKKPAELFFALSKHLKKVPMEYHSIVKAYVAGFACHYLLDRSAHPYVYSQQYAFCKAGEEGLTDKDGSDVHAVIESELDEMMLYTRTGQTVATYAPEKKFCAVQLNRLRPFRHIFPPLFVRYIQPMYAMTFFTEVLFCSVWYKGCSILPAASSATF